MTAQEKLTRSECNVMVLRTAQQLLEESQQQLNDLELDRYNNKHMHILVEKIKENIREAEAIIVAIKQSEVI